MVTDHTAAGSKFKQAVSEAKLAPPPEKLDASHQAILDELKARNGTAFDKAYVDVQHKAHVETVEMLDAYSKDGDNARMKQLAGDLLPTLRTHLDHATKLR